ncbi:MAG: cbb3-type cytochrome c oxidase subunit 3 [Gemmatimonadales bacterium]
MKLSDIMSHSGLSIYAEVALVIFLAAFCGIVCWVFRPSSSAMWQRAARLPLDDEAETSSLRHVGGAHE